MDRVVIKRDAAEKQTSGGIILPEDAKKQSNYGTIMMVGPGKFIDGVMQKVRLSVGQRVLFTDYHTTECGPNIVIADEEDVLAVIEG
jgi:chaperonin GroES